MSSKKRTQLILRSADISNLGYSGTTPFGPVERTTDYVGQNGSINTRQTNMTWNNINLRSLLGSMFKEGGHYNLKLESIAFGLISAVNTGIYTTVENDKNFNIWISGLPFLKSYSSSLALNNESLLASVRLPHGAQSYIFTYNNTNELTFQLTQNVQVENININIQYRDFLLNTVEPSQNLVVGYPHVQFIFSIYEAN